MNQTTNYGLGKPLETELYDIAVQNTNMDKIDTNLKSVSNTASSASSGLSTHTSNKSNPHEVTKAQIGLGNVPNVTTNNQTPSYTVPSSLSALTSGEILQTAFGKIAKAVNDLISHLANKSNPHSVTKSQVGLGNVDNTSDANKPISTATQTALNGKLGSTANAASASKLATARTVSLTGSVTGSGSFDGSANLSILTTTNHTHNYAGSSSAGGAANSANKLQTSRKITIGGDMTGYAWFDGTQDVTARISSVSEVQYPYMLNSFVFDGGGSIKRCGDVVILQLNFSNDIELNRDVEYRIARIPEELKPLNDVKCMGIAGRNIPFVIIIEGIYVSIKVISTIGKDVKCGFSVCWNIAAET